MMDKTHYIILNLIHKLRPDMDVVEKEDIALNTIEAMALSELDKIREHKREMEELKNMQY